MQDACTLPRYVHPDRHVEPGYDVRPMVGELPTLDAVFEHRDLRRREILREHLAQIDPRLAADVVLDLLAGDGLVVERLVQAAQDIAPFRIVVDDRADRDRKSTRLNS